VLVDSGGNILPLASSQDHKRALDGDAGSNTGGMGAYSPAPIITPEVEQKIQTRIVYPILEKLENEGHSYFGFLYVGLMIDNGEPYVLEFNVRLGDPETQPIMARMESDLVFYLSEAFYGSLGDHNIKWKADPAVCVVMASKGYPGDYKKGFCIGGINEAEAAGAIVFQAGTGVEGKSLVTAGGRVLGVTASGKDFAAAKEKAYTAVKKIECANLFYRTDIADRAIKR
jgi:phosphoribosylamine--glycine ligase